MNAELSEKIAKLPALNKAQLLPIWAENFKTPPPPKLRKQLMVPILAYRMQEREYGGLSHSARTRLKEIAASLSTRKPVQREDDALLNPFQPDGGYAVVPEQLQPSSRLQTFDEVRLRKMRNGGIRQVDGNGSILAASAKILCRSPEEEPVATQGTADEIACAILS